MGPVFQRRTIAKARVQGLLGLLGWSLGRGWSPAMFVPPLGSYQVRPPGGLNQEILFSGVTFQVLNL